MKRQICANKLYRHSTLKEGEQNPHPLVCDREEKKNVIAEKPNKSKFRKAWKGNHIWLWVMLMAYAPSMDEREIAMDRNCFYKFLWLLF